MYYINNLCSIFDMIIVSIFLILIVIVFRILFESFLSRHKILNFVMMFIPYVIVFFVILLFVFMLVF